jgi:lipid-A-disaccharide synthase
MELMVVAGEASGDLHAASLVRELRRRHPDLSVFGCGGPRLADAGCELLVNASDVAVVGLFEVVRHLPRIYGHYRRLVQAMLQRRPRTVVLVDFPDFNLRLACRARNAGINTTYFISPQLWAWREGRVETVRRCVSQMICIFPFEREFYARHGIEACYVGHPLLDIAHPASTREEFYRKHSLRPDSEVIAVLPGSRRREVEFHLPILLEAAAQLHRHRQSQFLIPVAPTLDPGFVRSQVPASQTDYVHVIAGEVYDAIAHARLAIVSSGTATVETALVGTPMVVVYRLSDWTYRLGRRLVRSPFYAMVNLILSRGVVPELIQHGFTSQAVVNWAVKLLDEGEERASMRAQLALVRERLGPYGAIGRAADIVERAILA